MAAGGTPIEKDDAAALRTLMRRGQELAQVPRAQVDMRWHAEASLIGDLPALAVALLRAERER